MVRTRKDEELRRRGAILFDVVGGMDSREITAMLVRLEREVHSDWDKLLVKKNAVAILEQELQCRGERSFEEPY